MRVENVVALTRGELKTTPSIGYFEDIKLNYLQIRRGDLFIALNPDEIKKAVENGAYGIIYDTDSAYICDDEVAFIKVRDVKTAAFSLARYEMLKRSFRFICVDPITLEIIKMINKSKNIGFIAKGDLISLFSTIKDDTTTILMGSDEEFLGELATGSVENFLPPKDCKLKILNTTLFESSILFEGSSLSIKMPKFMLKYLENAINILKVLKAEVDTSNLSFTQFFDPVFVDNFLYEREFGKTSRVIIFAKFLDMRFLRETMQYLSKNTKWARNLYILPPHLSNIDEKGLIITPYGSERELRDILEENDFNFALVVDANKTNIIKKRKESSPFLFDFD